MNRPGPPPPSVRPVFPPNGPPQSAIPSNLAPNRPSSPSPPLGYRPPPGSYPQASSGSGVPIQGASPVSRPNLSPFGSSPMATGPPTRVSGPTSNGPPVFSPGAQQGVPRFPSTGNVPQSLGQTPFSIRAPPPTAALPGSMQPPPFSAPPQGVPPTTGSSPFFGAPPPTGSSPFGAPPQGASPPLVSSYAPPPWQMQPGQVTI